MISKIKKIFFGSDGGGGSSGGGGGISKPEPTSTPTSDYVPSSVEQRIEYEKQKAQEAIKRQEEQNITPAKTDPTQPNPINQQSGPTITKAELESDPDYWLNKRITSTTFTKLQLQQELNNAEADWSKKAWTNQREKDALQAKIEALKKALNPTDNTVPENDNTTTTDKDVWDDFTDNYTQPNQQSSDRPTGPVTPTGPHYSSGTVFDPQKELESHKKHLEDMEKKKQGEKAQQYETEYEPTPTPTPMEGEAKPTPQPEPTPEPQPEPTPIPQPEPTPEPQPEPTPEPEKVPPVEKPPVQDEPPKEEEKTTKEEVKEEPKPIPNPFKNPDERTYDPTATTQVNPTSGKSNSGNDNMYLIGSGNYYGANDANNNMTTNQNLYGIDYKSFMPNIK